MSSVAEVLPASLQLIKTKLSAEKDLSPAEIRQIVLEANVKEEELMPWADFNHPVTDSYGRKLIYHGGHFEMMVMSWVPGDFSTIHDHGHTQWGAVQVFGPAEHATFRIKDNQITTLARWVFEPGDVVGVNHSLVHQMGNPTQDKQFLTLHIYGQEENLDSITGDARVFDLDKQLIQRVDGGVFFALPGDEVKLLENGPKADFATRLRHMLELTKRLLKIKQLGQTTNEHDLQKAIQKTFSLEHLQQFIDQGDDRVYGKTFKRELQEALRVQNQLLDAGFSGKHFQAYSRFYERVGEGFSILEGLN